MTKTLQRLGNSEALIISNEMKAHLGLDGSIEVQYADGKIILTKPRSLDEALKSTKKRYGTALKNLAK